MYDIIYTYTNLTLAGCILALYPGIEVGLGYTVYECVLEHSRNSVGNSRQSRLALVLYQVLQVVPV